MTLYERYKDDYLSDNTGEKYMQCKDCALRSDGTVWTNRFDKGYCVAFSKDKTSGKPIWIRTGEKKCPFYKVEKNEYSE